MNLTHLSDQQLMINTKALVKDESALLLKILHHIKEIDRRRLYSDYKQPGLLELVMTELGYPRDQALRRIQAMRMMRENPIVEEKIESGELNLTNIGIIQTFFSHEKKEGNALTAQEKKAVIEQVSGKSTREAQRIVFSMSSTPIKLNEKIKMIATDLYELTAAIDEEANLIIEKLKGMLAHSHPNISNGELIKILGKIGLVELTRVKPKASKQENIAVPFKNSKAKSVLDDLVAVPRPDSKTKSKSQLSIIEINQLFSNAKISSPSSKAEIKRQMWKRDKHKCTNCGSTYAVQEDHRTPKAKGGQYTLDNMRLLCRSCNQRAAIKHFGVNKMENFLAPQSMKN